MNAAYTPDWQGIRRRVATRPWAANVLAAIGSDFTRWTDDLVIPGPDRPSAWTHHYFCDADGAPLRFDPAAPASHACTRCGRAYTGEPWDGAWRTTMHNAAAAQAQRAALLVRLADDHRAAEELERIAAAYAGDYLSYDIHGVNAGRGRVHPQSLDEAVWAVCLLRALRWADDALTPATSTAADAMARAIADLCALRSAWSTTSTAGCWRRWPSAPSACATTSCSGGAATPLSARRRRSARVSIPRASGTRSTRTTTTTPSPPCCPTARQQGPRPVRGGGAAAVAGDHRPARPRLLRHPPAGLRRRMGRVPRRRLRPAGRGRLRDPARGAARSRPLLRQDAPRPCPAVVRQHLTGARLRGAEGPLVGGGPRLRA
ncbi:hypothetical protein [Nonomuraea dietziae]|uniref:hypothetical protein n=1 Tax=Nonomuraea dietziae TaxID=65515 RepID=UPI0031E27D7D